MLDLSRKFNDFVVFEGEYYPLNLSFDNILKLSEMFDDEAIHMLYKPHFALKMLTGVTFDWISIEQAMNLYKDIFKEHIEIKSALDDVVEYDLAGNPLPKFSNDDEDEKIYSLKYDSGYIYASFLQAYNIDLFEEQGKLHWKKFNALLASLPEGTKFIEVTKIRAWKPSKGDSSEYKEHMRKLQEQYRLPE